MGLFDKMKKKNNEEKNIETPVQNQQVEQPQEQPVVSENNTISEVNLNNNPFVEQTTVEQEAPQEVAAQPSFDNIFNASPGDLVMPESTPQLTEQAIVTETQIQNVEQDTTIQNLEVATAAAVDNPLPVNNEQMPVESNPEEVFGQPQTKEDEITQIVSESVAAADELANPVQEENMEQANSENMSENAKEQQEENIPIQDITEQEAFIPQEIIESQQETLDEIEKQAAQDPQEAILELTPGLAENTISENNQEISQEETSDAVPFKSSLQALESQEITPSVTEEQNNEIVLPQINNIDAIENSPSEPTNISTTPEIPAVAEPQVTEEVTPVVEGAELPVIKEIPETPAVPEPQVTEEVTPVVEGAEIPVIEEVPETPAVPESQVIEEISPVVEGAELPVIEEVPETPAAVESQVTEEVTPVVEGAEIPVIEEIPETPAVPELQVTEEVTPVVEGAEIPIIEEKEQILFGENEESSLENKAIITEEEETIPIVDGNINNENSEIQINENIPVIEEEQTDIIPAFTNDINQIEENNSLDSVINEVSGSDENENTEIPQKEDSSDEIQPIELTPESATPIEEQTIELTPESAAPIEEQTIELTTANDTPIENQTIASDNPVEDQTIELASENETSATQEQTEEIVSNINPFDFPTITTENIQPPSIDMSSINQSIQTGPTLVEATPIEEGTYIDEPNKTKFCGNCGIMLTDESSICPSCGEPID